MHKGLLIILFAIAGLTGLGATNIVGVVTKVYDGDTVWVTDTNKVRYKIRLDRIDAPEAQQEYGKESTIALKRMIEGRKVRVDTHGSDRYGRVLGIIYVGTNDINLAMVRYGNAWHYSYHDKTPAYIEAEKEARAKKVGLWSYPHPMNPYDFRRSRK